MLHEHYIPALFTEAEPADIVVEQAGKTYIGRYDRAKFDSEQEAEAQNIWSIRVIDSSVEGTIKTLYPNGSQRAVFCWNDKASYNYKYAL